jgi:hypothetical protein
VAVQLPGYTGALNNGTGSYPGLITAEMVWAMRLQQQAGVAAAGGAIAAGEAECVATYDLSCSAEAGAPGGGCPYGSVHNVEKVGAGQRVAQCILWFQCTIGGVIV